MNRIELIRNYMTKGYTPKVIVKNMIGNNPMLNNLFSMAESGDTGSVEAFAGRNYRGYGYLDDMNESYDNYNESKESYRRGNYGAGKDSMKSLDYMLKSVCQFMKMLKEDAETQEEVELIREYTHKIGEMM